MAKTGILYEIAEAFRKNDKKAIEALLQNELSSAEACKEFRNSNKFDTREADRKYAATTLKGTYSWTICPQDLEEDKEPEGR